MSEEKRKPKRTYFRPTTVQQRRLLFETFEQTHDIQAACSVAHVARRTFFYWQRRFRAGGYAALEQELSRAPHKTRIPPTPEATVQEVIAYRQAHPGHGYRRIAAELKKAHEWQAVISPTQVRRILLKAGLVAAPAAPAPPGQDSPAVHAPAPEQTVNIDLCVVPVNHQADEPLVPVSMQEAAEAAFPPFGPGAGSDELPRAGL
jgi:transposase